MGSKTAATIMPSRERRFRGTATLAVAALRRDRVRIAAWSLSLPLMAWAVAGTWDKLYPDAASRIQFGITMSADPALTSLLGPLYDPVPTGSLTAWRIGAFMSLGLALVNVFLVVRNSRAEEQDGRAELVQAAPIGRMACLAAAVVPALVLDLIFAALTITLLGGRGLGWAGAAAFGSVVAGTAAVFAGVAALTAQVARTSRGANGLASLVATVAFTATAIGNALAQAGGPLVWASPFGWVEQTRAYAGERWWTPPLAGGVACVLLVIALLIAGRRELGDGLTRARSGRLNGAQWLRGPWSAAWRLDRATLLAWSLAVTILGCVIGSLVSSSMNLLTENPRLAQFLVQMGGTARISDAYVITMITLFAQVAAAFGVSVVLRAGGDEAAGRTELALSTTTGRTAWLLARIGSAVLGAVIVLALGAAGVGLSFGASSGRAAIDAARYLGSSLLFAPAVMVLIALAGLLVGVAPRLAWIAWLAITYCVVVGEFGPLLSLPEVMTRVTPFWYVSRWPGESVQPLQEIALLAVAAALTAAGLYVWNRRDVPQ